MGHPAGLPTLAFRPDNSAEVAANVKRKQGNKKSDSGITSGAKKNPDTSGRSEVRQGRARNQPPDGVSTLEAGEINRRLELRSPLLVEELHQIAQDRLAEENSRHQNLMTKASSLLGAIGATIGLTLTFAVSAFSKLNLGGWALYSSASLFTTALMLAGMAAYKAIKASAIRLDHETVSEQHVFNETLLPECDAESNEALGLSTYRRSIAGHIWRIFQNEFAIDEQIARNVRDSQTYYMAFLTNVLVLGAVLAMQLLLTP